MCVRCTRSYAYSRIARRYTRISLLDDEESQYIQFYDFPQCLINTPNNLFILMAMKMQPKTIFVFCTALATLYTHTTPPAFCQFFIFFFGLVLFSAKTMAFFFGVA